MVFVHRFIGKRYGLAVTADRVYLADSFRGTVETRSISMDTARRIVGGTLQQNVSDGASTLVDDLADVLNSPSLYRHDPFYVDRFVGRTGLHRTMMTYGERVYDAEGHSPSEGLKTVSKSPSDSQPFVDKHYDCF